MARGWESKSVEAQIQESAAAAAAKKSPALTAEDLQRQRKRSELELSRRRVEEQLAASGSERYSEMLRRALAELEAQIAALCTGK